MIVSVFWILFHLKRQVILYLGLQSLHLFQIQHGQREGYPETRIFCSNVSYVLAQTICIIRCKHEARSKLIEFTPEVMFTKFEADCLCQKNITYITTKDSGFRVSLPLWRIACLFSHTVMNSEQN